MRRGGGIGEYIKEGIARIAVPYFFIISGYFLGLKAKQPGWYKRAVGKRVKSVVMPYFIWCILYGMLVNLVVLGANIISGRDFDSNIQGVVKILGLDCSNYPLLFPLWYLRSLFVLVLISPVIVVAVNRGAKYARFLLFILALLSILRPLLTCGWYDFLSGAWGESGIFYFSLGILFANGIGVISLTNKIAWLLLFAGLVLFGIKVRLWGSWWDRETIRCAVVFHVAIICTLAGAWKLFRTWKHLNRFVKFAFPLYLLHQIIFWVIYLIIPRTDDSFLGYSIYWIIGCGFAIIVYNAVNLVCPSAIRELIWGGRDA